MAELNRLKRYAPWIRRLVVIAWGLPEEITKLFVPTWSNTQPLLHFRLRELSWRLNRPNFSLFTTFLSPHLTKIDIKMDPFGRSAGKVPTEVVAVMRMAFRMFPSSLQSLSIYLGIGPEAGLIEEIGLTHDISTFILRCGESLRGFHSNLMLSPEGVTHLVNLPHLRDWTTEQKPPRVTALIRNGIPGGPTSLLPSLRSLRLRGEAAPEWFSLFDTDTTKHRCPPRTVVGRNLSHLIYNHPTLPIDSTLLSKLIPLTNLVEITAGLQCMQRGAGCASRFSDQDVEHLALALPKLEVLVLGETPCGANTCPTTILSLLFLSIHCASLKLLSVHFRTTHMAMDVMAMVDYAHSHDLHRRPKCVLEELVAGDQIAQLEDHEFALASMGISTIFPSLTRIQCSQDYGRLEHVVTMCGKVQESTDLMKFLNELRLSELSGEDLSSSSSLVSSGSLGGGDCKGLYSGFSFQERIERFLNEKLTPATQKMTG